LKSDEPSIVDLLGTAARIELIRIEGVFVKKVVVPVFLYDAFASAKFGGHVAGPFASSPIRDDRDMRK
jgi:hypothetical protein